MLKLLTAVRNVIKPLPKSALWHLKLFRDRWLRRAISITSDEPQWQLRDPIESGHVNVARRLIVAYKIPGPRRVFAVCSAKNPSGSRIPRRRQLDEPGGFVRL